MLQVSKYLSYAAFPLCTPWNQTGGVRVKPATLTKSQIDNCSPKTSPQLQCGASVFHPPLAFLSHSALSAFQNTLHSSVSVLPQPFCISSPESDAVCCGALTLSIVHIDYSVCVCLPSACVWVYSDSLAGLLMATTSRPQRLLTWHHIQTLYYWTHPHTYFKEGSHCPSSIL